MLPHESTPIKQLESYGKQSTYCHSTQWGWSQSGITTSFPVSFTKYRNTFAMHAGTGGLYIYGYGKNKELLTGEIFQASNGTTALIYWLAIGC